MTTRENAAPGPPSVLDAMPADDERPERLADLADAWLRAEAVSVGQPGSVDLARAAAERATAYEEGLTAASTEDVRLAWQLALDRQGRTDAGSDTWRTAARVAELLRFEYAAREPSDAVPAPHVRPVAQDVRHFST